MLLLAVNVSWLLPLLVSMPFALLPLAALALAGKTEVVLAGVAVVNGASFGFAALIAPPASAADIRVRG